MIVIVVVVVATVAAGILVLPRPSGDGAGTGGENGGGGTTEQSFSISVSPEVLRFMHGEPVLGDNFLTITFSNQLAENLGYEVQGLPEGVSYSGEPGPYSLDPPSPPTTFILTFTVEENTQFGIYPATVVCTDMSENLTSSDNFELRIVQPLVNDAI